MLRVAMNAYSDVQLRTHGYARLTDLMFVSHPSGIHGASTRSQCAAQKLRKLTE